METVSGGERRVYRDELSRRLGMSKTWVRTLEKAGRIRRARYDDGSRRGYWLESEAQEIIARRITAG